ncbi:hypothetical protein HYALB_00012424 [Hymenoscyphus albidus]|uniref:Uncharacterized protein n=1 Tax=Hymenoscyphus albidus TaxID=595503 RepID=A0A9N9LSW5_9HELO|nr:hypothetical protein HYALB_00012424 [Hymenoscyphus albidus]
MYYLPFLSPKKPKQDVSSATKAQGTKNHSPQSEGSPTFSASPTETPSEEDNIPDSPLLSGSWLDISPESDAYTLGSHQTSHFPQDAQDSKPHRPLSITRKFSCSSSTFELLSHSAIQHEMELDAEEAARQQDLELQKLMEEEEFLRKDAEARAAIRKQDRIQREKDLEGGMCGYERNCPFGDGVYFEDLILGEDGNLRERTEEEARVHKAKREKEAEEKREVEERVAREAARVEEKERVAREAARVEEKERVSRMRIAEEILEAAGEDVCAGGCWGCKNLEHVREAGNSSQEGQVDGSDGDNIEACSPTVEEASPRSSTESSSKSHHSNQNEAKEQTSPTTAATSPLRNTVTRVMGMKTTGLTQLFEKKEKEKDIK